MRNIFNLIEAFAIPASAFLIPIIVAFTDGSTYAFAFSITGFGIILHIFNVVLIRVFIHRRAPSTLENGTWEQTAGHGVVPKWVSVIGLLGVGFFASGVIVALLLFFNFVVNRG